MNKVKTINYKDFTNNNFVHKLAEKLFNELKENDSFWTWAALPNDRKEKYIKIVVESFGLIGS